MLVDHTLLVGEIVLVELRRALRDKIQLPRETIDQIDAFLREHTIIPKPATAAGPAVRDADDRWILSSALAGGADALVTGDQDLLASTAPLPVLTARGFWTMLRERGPETRLRP